MGLYYLETSALVKLYVREPGTEGLLQLAGHAHKNRFAVLSLSRVELRSAIRRREREGDISTTIASLVLDRFDQHMDAKFLKQVINDTVLDRAVALIDSYSLRAYDSIQLAGCLTLQMFSGSEEPVFVCSDRQLLNAAKAEQLRTLNPEEI